MQNIIDPIDRKLIKAELTKEKRLRSTNKSQNEIYIITAQDSPNVMQEIGRLREIAFRYYGGGTGNSVDIDEFDTMEDAYRQLIVWSPEEETILGGYRFPICLISRKSFSTNIFPIQWSWDVRLSHSNINPRAAVRKVFSYSTICGMV